MPVQKINYLDTPITEMDRYLFGNGTHYLIYQKLGSHPMILNNIKGMYFAVWAPHATSVSIVGDFNNWNPDSHFMTKLADSGIYDIFVPDLDFNELYKFAITTSSEKLIFKADPYASYAEYRPGTASITSNLSSFEWQDNVWMKSRTKKTTSSEPMSIYEVHIGSWKRHPSEDNNGYYNYKEAAIALTEYVLEMGYTHVELMGILEHPFDGSWGYQVTGYYAPTSRFGTPADFMFMINYLHMHGIGVILDWVPAHFPKDSHGLSNFDGEPLYEYADSQKGEHPEWGTKIFDYSKHEVSNFLIANALYWVNEFHIDGLRVDAVASMLYLDYGRESGNWLPNIYGGNENIEAIEFFKHLNSIIDERGKGAIVIAEESTAWPKVTHTIKDNGLGFSYKWNMGWMHDFLEYMKLDPYFRKYNHHKMTFGTSYFTSENFILVLSHDEVVHLKSSMIGKMSGFTEDKFSNLKLGYTFMIGHPGKKLLFMGQDFGQWHEWNEETELDWYLINEPAHRKLQNYVKDLLHIYKEYPALYVCDNTGREFEWVNADDYERSIYSFIRHGNKEDKKLLFIFNFTPVERSDYMVGVPSKGNYTLILDECHGRYTANDNLVSYAAKHLPCDRFEYSISFNLPSYGIAVFEF